MKVNLFFFNFQYMIQRIQTLYISLYIIIKCFLLYMSLTYKSLFHFFINKVDLLSSVLILLIIFSIVTLLSFKKRKTQIKLMYFLITLQLLFMISISIFTYMEVDSLIFLQNYQTILCIIGLLLLLLCLRGIKKDQNLIDSIDRIR